MLFCIFITAETNLPFSKQWQDSILSITHQTNYTPQIQRQNEDAAHITRLEAQRVSEEADTRVVALEAENQAFNQKRRTVEEQVRTAHHPLPLPPG